MGDSGDRFPAASAVLRVAGRRAVTDPPAGMPSDLELRHRGTPRAEPYVLTIELASRGRKDIPNDAYNDHQPLEFDVGSRIVEILQVISEPKTLPKPEITTDGSRLRIGGLPALIGTIR
jgi:hypothetical protein